MPFWASDVSRLGPFMLSEHPPRIGDVASKHALPENALATFQVASQFNCLEFVGPSVVPEDGITGYAARQDMLNFCDTRKFKERWLESTEDLFKSY